MAVLFFSLRGVPEDEAEDIRELLQTNEIAFYETSAGSFGISMPAIWLYTQEDLQKIQPLFDAYQQQRFITQRALYQELKQQGEISGFWQANQKRPIQFIVYTSIIALTLYLSGKWLFELGL
jgi:Family of unknown function (DUF6164)